MANVVKRAYPPVAEELAYVTTANGLAPVVASLADAGVVPTPTAPTPRITKVTAAAVDTAIVPATTNRLSGSLVYEGAGALYLTLNGRAASVADHDVVLYNSDALPLAGRTLAIRGIWVGDTTGFARAYEELSS